ncbi:SdpI family protein [Actinomyces sp. MRS3W]|uniref:SdpI family protein n=1 Tax=Actinomyces sp. MRS3W TaxID=2800796 RepID=UPI0028FD685C|nr:SdpI family protein [Actinomyces sp. MRS3W]MDU0348996.1 SdpI family protein [Actinomyces sp. MRS3W]
MPDLQTDLLIVVVFAVAGLVVTWIGVRMRRGRLRPNYWAGVRIPRAYRSEKDWYAIQHACGPGVLLLGFVCFDSAALFALQAALSDAMSFLVLLVIVTVQLILGIAYTWYLVLQVK